MRGSALGAVGALWLLLAPAVVALNVFPVDKIFGVNIGSWLVIESWMMQNEWTEMGGGNCSACELCTPASEYDLVQKIGQEEADKIWPNHWSSWFNQTDIDAIAKAGINTARVPMGNWIIEQLKGPNDTYPSGGFKYLRNALLGFSAANINVIIDLHGFMGAQTGPLQFTGQCVNATDLKVYQPGYYQKALMTSAIFTVLMYRDPAFNTAFGIGMMNEPKINNTVDENYATLYTNYVEQSIRTVRAMEYALGVHCNATHNFSLSTVFQSNTPPALGTPPSQLNLADTVVQAALNASEPIIREVLADIGLEYPWDKAAAVATPSNAVKSSAGPSRRKLSLWQREKRMFERVKDFTRRRISKRSNETRPLKQLYCRQDNSLASTPYNASGTVTGTPVPANASQPALRVRDQCIVTGFMDVSWGLGIGPDPRSYQNGPMWVELHPYASFQGLDDTELAYLQNGCYGGGLFGPPENNAMGNALNATPVIAGEWWAAVATYSTLKPPVSFFQQFTQEQKYKYTSLGDGWIFWAWKLEQDDPTRSYQQALAAGYMDPVASDINSTVCDWYTPPPS